MNVVLIDNYDSFTHNLAQAIGKLGARVQVFRNDAILLDELLALAPTHVVLSPGPGHPAVARDFGVCADVVASAVGSGGLSVPVLGVCLGHQGIVHHMGGRVVRAPQIVHGKMHNIAHDGRGVYAGLPATVQVMRYHSLIAERESLPAALEVTATTADGLIMGVRHRELPIEGVQFHPESVGTPEGERMLANFMGLR